MSKLRAMAKTSRVLPASPVAALAVRTSSRKRSTAPGRSHTTQIHRTVNTIAVAALIATAGAGKNLVDQAAARAAIAEITATD